MKVRMAQVSDIPNIIPLAKAGNDLHYEARNDMFRKREEEEYYVSLKKMIENDTDIILVVEDEGKIKGYIDFAYLPRQNKVLYVNQIYVDENSRCNGYGKALIDEAIRIGKENNCVTIELNCWSFNEDALKFYRKLDFEEQRIMFEKKL